MGERCIQIWAGTPVFISQGQTESMICTHKPKDGHKHSPEEGWEGGQDTIGQIGHHETRTNDRWEQTLESTMKAGQQPLTQFNVHVRVRCVRADLLVVVCVERQAEQVGGIFGGAVGLGASLVLYVFKVKSWAVSVTGGGPDQLGGLACMAQNRFQLPDLENGTGDSKQLFKKSLLQNRFDDHLFLQVFNT